MSSQTRVGPAPPGVKVTVRIFFAGMTGMGKSSLLRHLIPDGREGQRVQPTTSITWSEYEYGGRNGFKWVARGYDTVGWASTGSIYRNVEDVLREAYNQWLQSLHSAHRSDTYSPPIMHVCLYFLIPHRIAQVDLAFMQKLSSFMPVIPLLAKADTYSMREIEEQGGNLLNALTETPVNIHILNQHAHLSFYRIISTSRSADYLPNPTRYDPWQTDSAISDNCQFSSDLLNNYDSLLFHEQASAFSRYDNWQKNYPFALPSHQNPQVEDSLEALTEEQLQQGRQLSFYFPFYSYVFFQVISFPCRKAVIWRRIDPMNPNRINLRAVFTKVFFFAALAFLFLLYLMFWVNF